MEQLSSKYNYFETYGIVIIWIMLHTAQVQDKFWKEQKWTEVNINVNK